MCPWNAPEMHLETPETFEKFLKFPWRTKHKYFFLHFVIKMYDFYSYGQITRLVKTDASTLNGDDGTIRQPLACECYHIFYVQTPRFPSQLVT